MPPSPLARLASRDRLPETGGTGRGRYLRLSRQACEELGETLAYHVDSRLTRENAKGRVLSALQHGPLSNAQIREITQMNRQQATRLMELLRLEGLMIQHLRQRLDATAKKQLADDLTLVPAWMRPIFQQITRDDG